MGTEYATRATVLLASVTMSDALAPISKKPTLGEELSLLFKRAFQGYFVKIMTGSSNFHQLTKYTVKVRKGGMGSGAW